MNCPYRKTIERIIPIRADGELHNIPTKEIEGFEECIGKDCPLYYEITTKHTIYPHCHRVEREKSLNE